MVGGLAVRRDGHNSLEPNKPKKKNICWYFIRFIIILGRYNKI